MSKGNRQLVNEPRKTVAPILFEIGEHEYVEVTPAVLHAGMSRYGQWGDEQLACLGVPMPKRAGWKLRLYGTLVRREQVEQFLALKDAHLSRKPRRRRTNTNRTGALTTPA